MFEISVFTFTNFFFELLIFSVKKKNKKIYTPIVYKVMNVFKNELIKYNYFCNYFNKSTTDSRFN